MRLLEKAAVARRRTGVSPNAWREIALCSALLVDRALYAKMIGWVYSITAQLEACLEKHQSNPTISAPGVKEFLAKIRRTEAFENDLMDLQGVAWRSQLSRTEAVDVVIERLRVIDDEDPAMLLAYAADLYLALVALRDLRIEMLVSFSLGLKAGKGARLYQCAGITREECCKVLDSLNLNEDKERRFIEESLRVSQSMKSIISTVSLHAGPSHMMKAVSSPLVQSILAVLLGAFFFVGFSLVRLIH